ncbi:MAG: hypothetical protein GAK31_00940 [Stenotrophomonas maltophilia]|uniref:Phage protein n=1 Tax=Stenotrophomonas maltophilia TaxID=40324 RepID=A0A7V8FKG6_STEMA|nr:MAG: hypothetical protein GAK31_00940 [Stenotrophomonas maltophilia]
MADIDLEVRFDALHDAIRARIAEAFPDFKTVEFYRDDEDTLFPPPACLLAMTEAEPSAEDDAGSGQFPVLLRFEASIIMAHRTPQTHANVRKAALALATWLYQLKRFPPCDAIKLLAIDPDEFSPKADKFVVWRVEFAMLGFLGETAWKNDGTVPIDVMYSFSPDVGQGNEEHYEPLQ